ncbi:unnamed protein product [Arctia plantaginis]|uniref:Uncharacterized protein n=1 Tax=Arctia plantaginis TaxID=874455 RepID=A0A8S1AVN4_ARCPL|nr:unnamed protein product [Arctia plantaginis]
MSALIFSYGLRYARIELSFGYIVTWQVVLKIKQGIVKIRFIKLKYKSTRARAGWPDGGGPTRLSQTRSARHGPARRGRPNTDRPDMDRPDAGGPTRARDVTLITYKISARHCELERDTSDPLYKH